jgi:hypothetical protein
LDQLAKLFTQDQSPDKAMSKIALKQYGVGVKEFLTIDKNKDRTITAAEIFELFQNYDKTMDTAGIDRTIIFMLRCPFKALDVEGKCCKQDNLAEKRVGREFHYKCCEHGAEAVSRKPVLDYRHKYPIPTTDIRVCKAPVTSLCLDKLTSDSDGEKSCQQMCVDEVDAYDYCSATYCTATDAATKTWMYANCPNTCGFCPGGSERSLGSLSLEKLLAAIPEGYMGF